MRPFKTKVSDLKRDNIWFQMVLQKSWNINEYHMIIKNKI